MARKTVKTITVSGITLPIYGSTIGQGVTADIDSTAAYGDDFYSEIPRKCKHSNDLSLVVLNEGGACETLAALAGTVQAIGISVTFWDGDSDGTTQETASDSFTVVSCTPNDITVDGDQKATCTLVIRRQGPSAS